MKGQFIGTIPLGYADGWTRAMQGFDVPIDGQRCLIVGRVSMDQITVRLPEKYPLGTPVVFIGKAEQKVSQRLMLLRNEERLTMKWFV